MGADITVGSRVFENVNVSPVTKQDLSGEALDRVHTEASKKLNIDGNKTPEEAAQAEKVLISSTGRQEKDYFATEQDPDKNLAMIGANAVLGKNGYKATALQTNPDSSLHVQEMTPEEKVAAEAKNAEIEKRQQSMKMARARFEAPDEDVSKQVKSDKKKGTIDFAKGVAAKDQPAVASQHFVNNVRKTGLVSNDYGADLLAMEAQKRFADPRELLNQGEEVAKGKKLPDGFHAPDYESPAAYAAHRILPHSASVEEKENFKREFDKNLSHLPPDEQWQRVSGEDPSNAGKLLEGNAYKEHLFGKEIENLESKVTVNTEVFTADQKTEITGAIPGLRQAVEADYAKKEHALRVATDSSTATAEDIRRATHAFYEARTKKGRLDSLIKGGINRVEDMHALNSLLPSGKIPVTKDNTKKQEELGKPSSDWKADVKGVWEDIKAVGTGFGDAVGGFSTLLTNGTTLANSIKGIVHGDPAKAFELHKALMDQGAQLAGVGKDGAATNSRRSAITQAFNQTMGNLLNKKEDQQGPPPATGAIGTRGVNVAAGLLGKKGDPVAGQAPQAPGAPTEQQAKLDNEVKARRNQRQLSEFDRNPK